MHPRFDMLPALDDPDEILAEILLTGHGRKSDKVSWPDSADPSVHLAHQQLMDGKRGDSQRHDRTQDASCICTHYSCSQPSLMHTAAQQAQVLMGRVSQQWQVRHYSGVTRGQFVAPRTL